jgi:hypothetical protein
VIFLAAFLYARRAERRGGTDETAKHLLEEDR